MGFTGIFYPLFKGGAGLIKQVQNDNQDETNREQARKNGEKIYKSVDGLRLVENNQYVMELTIDGEKWICDKNGNRLFSDEVTKRIEVEDMWKQYAIEHRWNTYPINRGYFKFLRNAKWFMDLKTKEEYVVIKIKKAFEFRKENEELNFSSFENGDYAYVNRNGEIVRFADKTIYKKLSEGMSLQQINEEFLEQKKETLTYIKVEGYRSMLEAIGEGKGMQIGRLDMSDSDIYAGLSSSEVTYWYNHQSEKARR